MLGEKCQNNCAFCAQARESTAPSGRLSRVAWIPMGPGEAVKGIGAACRAGSMKRICLQVVQNEKSRQTSAEALKVLTREGGAPVCISGIIESVQQAEKLIELGAERICIALDAATPEIFAHVKGGDWHRRWKLLNACAASLTGKIVTHLIVGMGETEEEMIRIIGKCLDLGVVVGLFAFTPVRGTAWERRQPPSVGQYRRVQIACFLLREGYNIAKFRFQDGKLAATGLPEEELAKCLSGGEAFETCGCPDCNRPYYNERPGKVLYNHPRALSRYQAWQAIYESGLIAVPQNESGGTGECCGE
jgi:biotin synthase